MYRIATGGLALALSLTLAAPIGALQNNDDALKSEAATLPLNPLPLMVAGTVGSTVGFWAGLYGAAAIGDGEVGLLVLPIVAGATALGTAAGINLGSGGRVAISEAIGPALVGMLVGWGTVYAINTLSDRTGDRELLIGYSISQGTFAAAVTAMVHNSKEGARR